MESNTERAGWLLPVLCKECLVVLVLVLVVSEIDINPEGWMEGGKHGAAQRALSLDGWHWLLFLYYAVHECVHEPCEDSGSATFVATGVWRQQEEEPEEPEEQEDDQDEHEGALTPTDTAAGPECHGQSCASEELFVTNAINQLSAAHRFQ
ncbi:hypothetical protein BKA64DRAFT_81370 [Cadophora sp. MPI-SDFR-AT-0126]|nr:hypothetical protein BKA64DRAFT_81370 [Leotiomycetes sp. MPI-SDFR-AT-0126]